MWDKNFEGQIFASLVRINGDYSNNCYAAFFNNDKYFIKKIGVRFHENIDITQERIEQTESINKYFYDNGIKTVLAISFDGEYSHRKNNDIWIAYPWIDLQSIRNITEELCYDIGLMLKRLHSIPQKLKYINKQNQQDSPNFNWIDYFQKSNDISLYPFSKLFDELQYYANYGDTCLKKISSDCIEVLSHRDIHLDNLFYNENDFVIIDWELSGCTNPYIELFDVALNLSGFCRGKTNISYFKSVIEGYKNFDDKTPTHPHFEHIVGSFYFLIIEHMCDLLNAYIFDKDETILKKANNYLVQFYELQKFEKEFINILMG